jgi:hypothetical protein
MSKRRQQQLRVAKKKRDIKARDTSSILIKVPSDPTSEIPTLNYSAWVKAISNHDPKVWDVMVQFMHHFETHHYSSLGLSAVKIINSFIQLSITALVDETFLPDLEQSQRLIQFGHIFQHLVAISSNETTTAALRTVLLNKNNLPKVLMLQNPRCSVQLEQSKFFDANPVLASMWYQTYMLGISSPTKQIQQSLYRHLKNFDERWVPYAHHVTGLYFSSTYHAHDCVRNVKRIMNKAITDRIEKVYKWEFTNNPNPRSIGIITNKWHRNHAVYKSAGPLVEQWKDDYKLTLIWTAEKLPETAVLDYFDEVCHCYFRPDGSLLIPDRLKNNDFQMIYFPDIGMTDESVWLSNCRMAPIQAVGYGHPDTTGDNNQIDYFFGGQVETEADEDYSETRVLVPGLAQEPAWPSAERKHNYNSDDVVRVNCVWGPDKYNYTLLTILAEINNVVVAIRKEKELDQPPHEIHLFASPGINRYAALPSFAFEISKILPNAIIHNEQEYFDYMENAEMHDFSLNSFPFGCYNVLIESLFMGLPFITMVGDRFYNRAGMWLNERVGMEKNNSATPRDFINKAAELITDPDALKAQREHLASLDLKEKLFTLKNNHFLEAIQYTIANHPFTRTKLIGVTNDEA